MVSGKSGLHARGEGERVLALESREGTRASRRVARILDAFTESYSTYPKSPPLESVQLGASAGPQSCAALTATSAGLQLPSRGTPLSPLPFPASPALGNREPTCHFEGLTSFLLLLFHIIGIKQYEVVL